VRLTFLGTGTSYGVPVVGCSCKVCTSPDPRDRRFRHSALISWNDGRTVLVDTPPELRLQLLAAAVERIDAVWFTHVHADHLHGIDDLRVFSIREGRSVEGFAAAEARDTMERRFDYIFSQDGRPQPGSTKPQISLTTLVPGRAEIVAGEHFLPIEVPHGPAKVLGFRVGDLGYVTDAKRLPPEALAALQGVRVLVLNALWWGDPHPTHLNIEEAIETAGRVGAPRTYLTHLTHRVGHAEVAARLPSGVFPAHDGLTVSVGGEEREPENAEGMISTGRTKP